jgi:hypothetical protein
MKNIWPVYDGCDGCSSGVQFVVDLVGDFLDGLFGLAQFLLGSFPGGGFGGRGIDRLLTTMASGGKSLICFVELAQELFWNFFWT